MPKYKNLIYIFALVVVALCAYGPSFNNSFVYDDQHFVVENSAIRNLNLESVAANFTQYDTVASDKALAKDVWRPLMTTSFALDYRLWGLDSRFYHIENVLLHILNAILVYIITFLIIGNFTAAIIAAVIFCVHPVQTEAVTWISGRSNLLFMLFFLSAFVLHILNRISKGPAFCYGMSLVLFCLSLLSKEMAVVFPLICIIYDMHFYNREPWRSYLKYYWPFFLILSFYLTARFSVLGVMAQRSDWWGGGFFNSLLYTLQAVSEYIRLLVFPVNLRVQYPADIFANEWSLRLFLSVATLVIVVLGYLRFRKNKTVSFYILWFFVALLPVYNIVPFKAVMAERFLYLPIVGFASLAGLLFYRLYRRARSNKLPVILLISVTSLIIAFYVKLTIDRNAEWRDEISFYVNEARRSPTDPKAQYNFGYACIKEAQAEGADERHVKVYYMMAIDAFKKTLKLKPDSQIAFAGLANAYYSIGLYDDAILNFRKAIALQENTDMYNNLGVAYYKINDLENTGKALRKALAMDPCHVNASVNMGNYYFSTGEYDKANRMWQRAIYLAKHNEGLDLKMPKSDKGDR